jgi:hypothetical protein
MKSSREMVIAPEVASALNRQQRRRLESKRAAPERCFVCQMMIPAADPVAIVIVRDPGAGDLVTTAHPACHESTVVSRVAEPGDPAPLHWAPAVQEGPEPRAVLAVLHHRQLVAADPEGGPRDRFGDLLLSMGFEPAVDLLSMRPRRILGWTCRIEPDGRIEVESGHRISELTTETPLADDWLEIARSRGEIMLVEVAAARRGIDATAEVQRALEERRCYAGMVAVKVARRASAGAIRQ